MPYIDFGGGSTQTPVKETEQFHTCNNCIHRYIINKDLFYCTISGNIEFCNCKKPYACLFKNTIANKRILAIAIYIIKEDGTIVWTGAMGLFLADKEKSDNDVIKVFYKKAVPDLYTKEPRFKEKTIIPIIIAESIENKLFKPVGNIMPNYIINDVIKNLNDNINNLDRLTDD